MGLISRGKITFLDLILGGYFGEAFVEQKVVEDNG